jgi:hypothetical protein
MTDIGHPQGMKIPPAPLFQRGVLKSPFKKGGFRQQCPVRFLHGGHRETSGKNSPGGEFFLDK